MNILFRMVPALSLLWVAGMRLLRADDGQNDVAGTVLAVYHRRLLLRAAGLCLTLLMLCLLPENPAQASRPIDEMRGTCAQYALDLRNELTAMAGMPLTVPSLPQRGTVSPETPGWRPLSVTLHHSEAVTLATIPKRQGANAGLIPVTIPEDGRYCISAGSAVWIEVVQGRMRIEPIRFEMQTGCAALFKTVEYQLKQGADYWIELSGNTSTVTLLLSPTTR